MVFITYFSGLRDGWVSYKRSETAFFLWAMVAAFFINMEYAVGRPVAQSIFFSYYSVDMQLYIWIACVPLNFCIVWLYNKFFYKLEWLKIIFVVMLVSLITNSLCGLFARQVHPLSFFTYMWKESSIMFMFQQLWSMVHIKSDVSRSKHLYGMVCGVGACGAIFGSLVSGYMSTVFGSCQLLILSSILLPPLFYVFCLMFVSGSIANDVRTEVGSLSGVKLIGKSLGLKFIVMVVVLMHFSNTVVEQQFSRCLKETFPDQDQRSAFCGKMWGVVNFASLGLHLLYTLVIIRLIGLRKLHLLVPIALLHAAFAPIIVPSFSTVACSFGVLKMFDYSVVNIIREVLYVPMETNCKVKAKAVIDVFVYRSGKAVAALVVLAISACSQLSNWDYSWLPVIFFFMWLAVVAVLYRRISHDGYFVSTSKTKYHFG